MTPRGPKPGSEPRPAGQLAAALSHYLAQVYGVKAQLIPAPMRAEMEQTFNAGAQWMLMALGMPIAQGASKTFIKRHIEQLQLELNAYGLTRQKLLQIGNTRLTPRVVGETSPAKPEAPKT